MRTVRNFCVNLCPYIMGLLMAWPHTVSAQVVMGAMKDKFSADSSR